MLELADFSPEFIAYLDYRRQVLNPGIVQELIRFSFVPSQIGQAEKSLGNWIIFHGIELEKRSNLSLISNRKI
jgi:hypothetical protein